MMKLGVIGTSMITDLFISATQKQGNWQLSSVYSRNIERAKEFGNKYHTEGVEYFDDLEDFFTNGNFDVVYIASPNALHYQQVKQALQHDRNVIVEKPAFSNPTEFNEIYSILKNKPNLFFIEAARHTFTPNYLAVKQYVQECGNVSGANFTYRKYSSKYDAYLEGKNPNIFTKEFSGGALQDLGVYLVYVAVDLFGIPHKSVYLPHFLENGIDGYGTIILDYSDFQVTLNVGKTSNSHLSSEIYFDKKTLVIDNAGEFKRVELFDDEQNVKNIGRKLDDNPMIYEVEQFSKILNNQDKYQEYLDSRLDLCRKVNQVMYTLRQTAGLVFPADK